MAFTHSLSLVGDLVAPFAYFERVGGYGVQILFRVLFILLWPMYHL